MINIQHTANTWPNLTNRAKISRNSAIYYIFIIICTC